MKPSGRLRPVSQKRLDSGQPFGLQRSAPIRPVSDKRRAENRQRRAMADALFPERPPCGVTVARADAGMLPLAVCTGWADDLHEPLSRARLGSIVDPANACPVCRQCHDVLTFAPESELDWAYQAGLLAHSWQRHRRPEVDPPIETQ